MVKADIVFEKVTKIFGRGTDREVYALDEVTMEVEKGLMATLLGPSGCGKTTSLRLLAGFEHPTHGDIYLAGKRVNDVPPQRRNAAMVFQSYGLFPHMTVFENIAYGLKVKRLSRRDIKKKVNEVLNLVGLGGLGDRSTGKLSGGQQQRVALCRALVTEPDVLLFDEPLSNLDAKLRKGTREQIKNLQQELEITSVYVTHDQVEAMSISDKIMVMREGRIEQVGKPDEIYINPASRFVADFIGEANFYPGKIIDFKDKKATVQIFDVPITVDQDSDFSIGETVDVVIRPEAVDLVKPGSGDIDAKVRFFHYTGSIVTYELDLDNGNEMEVDVSNPQEEGLLKEGEKVGVSLQRHSIHLLKKENHLE